MITLLRQLRSPHASDRAQALQRVRHLALAFEFQEPALGVGLPLMSPDRFRCPILDALDDEAKRATDQAERHSLIAMAATIRPTGPMPMCHMQIF
ncbi:hypothetical protein [Dyella choica]|uniref:Uncharacterized protein n=1 Tax=Dyella choica TaxID=1927959 RepID=A0A432M188_9GAMM|nr:hypothetical protein [Dyella choica]RUL71017.1 hypothetical protein EKH80_19775 [Dyella choica]